MKISEYYNEMATQGASVSVLPFWYPPFAKSIYERSRILESQSLGDLSRSDFFKNKRNYYRGFTANALLQPLFPMADCVLSCLLRKIQQVTQRDPNIKERMGAGFMTGASTALLSNPYEVTVIASQKYGEAPRKAFRRVLQQSGIRGFYTGALPMAIKNGIFFNSIFILTPALQKTIDLQIQGSGRVYDIVTMLLAATVPAAMVTCGSIPIEVMAIMRQSDPSGKIHTSAFQAIKMAYHKHGKAIFKVGLGARVSACTIELAGFNLFRKFYLGQLNGEGL